MNEFNPMELLCGSFDAFPFPTVLLNIEGQNAYVNSQPCPIALEDIDFTSIPEINAVLNGSDMPPKRVKLALGGQTCSGIMEAHTVRTDSGISGALVIFRPDFAPDIPDFDVLPYVSSAIEAVWERIHRLSLLSSHVLIIGEEGVGKAKYAEALCRISTKGNARMLVFNQGSDLTATLASASEDTNTLIYVPYVDRLPKQILDRLASILSDKRWIDARGAVHALSNRFIVSALPDLARKVSQGEFPKELYNRVSIMPVYIPSLKERPEDIMPAANAWLEYYAKRADKIITGFSEEAMQIINVYSWPANHVGLRNTIQTAVNDCLGGYILASHLSINDSKIPQDRLNAPLHKIRDAYTKEHIRSLLEKYGNSVEGKRKAAKELGIGLSTLYRLLEKR